MPTAEAVASASQDNPMNPYSEFLLRTAERFGVPTVLCLLILWWAKSGIVEPLITAHFAFIDKIVVSHEQQTRAIGEVGDKLDTLISITRYAAEKEKTQQSPAGLR